MKFKGSNLDEQKKEKVHNRVEIQLSTTLYADKLLIPLLIPLLITNFFVLINRSTWMVFWVGFVFMSIYHPLSSIHPSIHPSWCAGGRLLHCSSSRSSSAAQRSRKSTNSWRVPRRILQFVGGWKKKAEKN